MLLADRLNCTGCGACKDVCPNKAIVMQADQFGLLFPNVQAEKCIECGLCEKICPALKEKGKSEDLGFYGFKNHDENVRMESSSGGLFSALAESIIDEGGYVIGCALNEDCKGSRHVLVHSRAELNFLRGSKYFQSNLQDSYTTVERLLADNKKVLFSGTPCQVAGLKAFLRKDYEGLFTVDFICHGVSAPLIWEKYVEFEEEKEKAKVKSVSFRDKSFGWHQFSLRMNFDNRNSKCIPYLESDYLLGFLYSLFLRDCCYRCHFKGGNYHSDITMADFWGIEKIKPEVDDNKGVSLAIIHTKKGLDSLFNVGRGDAIFEVDECVALKRNQCYFKPPKVNVWKNRAMKEYGRKPFDKVTEKYCGRSFFAKCRRVISRVLVSKGELIQ